MSKTSFSLPRRGARRAAWLRSLGVAVAALGLACAGSPPLPEGLGGDLAIECWRSGQGLLLKYTGPDGLVYARVDWEERPIRVSSHGAVSLLVLEPADRGRMRWPMPPGARRMLPILPPSAFARFRDRVIEERVPRGGRKAVVVDMGGFDVALFFDEAGRFRTVQGPLPDGVEVVARQSLETFLELAPATLERLLVEQGITAREVLFNTGDLGSDALPFLYVDLDSDVGAFVRIRRSAVGPEPGETVIPITRSITHLLRSHTIDLANRPMTSITRLLFAFTHAATDTFDAVGLPLVSRQPIPELSTRPGMDLDAWEARLDRMTGRPAERGRIAYLIDGEQFYPRLEEAIREAQERIDFRIYIFDDDDVALGMADLLRTQSKQGVRVRVLMDGVGSLAASTVAPVDLPPEHEAPASISAYLESESQVRVRALPNPFFIGDHSKVILIDSKRAFLGGMNIGREYRYEWHDMMVELTGPVVDRLQHEFEATWAGAGPFGDLAELFARLGSRRPARKSGDEGYPMRLLYTSATSSEIRATQLEAIRRSRRYIYVQNAYLTDDAFFYELVKARRRGVDVRVVVPLRSDQGQLTRENVLTANALFENGIRVYVYPGMSHLKAAVFDGWACLGSANLDQLSLRVNKEVNIATSEPVAVDALVRSLFERDFAVSPEMEELFPERWVDSLWELVGDYVF